jgi:membrane-bound ClpP family serine protease
MEITILLILILLAIIFQEHKTLTGALIFLAGITTLAFGLTTNTITSIGETITYNTVDPLITWVIGLTLLTISIIFFLNAIDTKKEKINNEY